MVDGTTNDPAATASGDPLDPDALQAVHYKNQFDKLEFLFPLLCFYGVKLVGSGSNRNRTCQKTNGRGNSSPR